MRRAIVLLMAVAAALGCSKIGGPLGRCRDESAPIPTLRMCPEVVNDVHDPRHGVGVAVNAAFKNVNWVAYPGGAASSSAAT